MGAGFGRIWAGTGGAAAGSSNTASAAAESKPRRRHFIPGGGHASIHWCNKIADVMGANDNNCEDFYDLEAKKLDGTTVRSFPLPLIGITKPFKIFNAFLFFSCCSSSSASCWARWCSSRTWPPYEARPSETSRR